MTSLQTTPLRTKRLLLIVILATVAAGCFFYSFSNRTKGVTRTSSFINFDFRKIDAYIDDSLTYFKAIDSIYALLPNKAQGSYENYACKRGYYKFVKRDAAKTLLYTDSMLVVLNDLKDDPGYQFWYSTALAYKGDDLRALGRFGEAFGFYFLAREAIQQTGDSCLYRNYSATLGMVAYQQLNYVDAAEYFKQAFFYPAYCDDKGNSNTAHMQFATQQSYLNNIGLCYSKINQSDSALFYFDSALNYVSQNAQHAFTYDKDYNRIIDTVYIEKARGVIFGNKAVDLIKNGQYADAEFLLKESIRLNSMPAHALEDVPYSQAKLAGLHLKQKRINEAAVVLKALKAGLDSFPNTELLKRWHHLQADYHQQEANAGLANLHLTRYVVMKDSMDAKAEGLTSSDIRKEFAHIKTQHQLYNLQKEDALKNKYLLVALAVGGFSMIIGFLIWRNYRLSGKHITALEKLNREVERKNVHLQNTLSSLEKSHEENSRMMKIVAHDLRNPIGGIAGLSAIMLKTDSFPESQRGMLEMIHKSSNHSIELIQDLVHINTSALDRYGESMELRELLCYCIEMLHLKSEEKNQRISLTGSPAMVKCDRDKLWRVFNNLISNAIKFSPENTEIRVALSVKDNQVLVSVKDQGIGIPESLSNKLFDISGEAKRRGTAGEPSFGLGLGISKQIVESSNGRIWFENNKTKGASFFVSFPIT
ncbi:tetratricopeptide repeat-containing sensor histidine kinase [Flavitalea sp.]|nr:ATP-binding protein [Flavitalea sp.]